MLGGRYTRGVSGFSIGKADELDMASGTQSDLRVAQRRRLDAMMTAVND